MADFDWSNEFPMEFGGGPTLAERHYNALVSAWGKGGVAADTVDSIDAAWRQCVAKALGDLDAMAEHAALQVFPRHAEELLYYYEDVLALTPDADTSLTERQEAAQAEWTRLARADGPSIDAALRRIDERFELLAQEYDYTATTHDGRSLAPYVSPPYYGPRSGTDFPNFSDDFTVYVLLDIGGGTGGAAEQRAIARAERMLHLVLPSWCDFHVVTSVGFILDQSPLDVTALGN